MSNLSYWLRACIYSTVITVGWPAVALACRCLDPTPRQAYGTADSVAFGEILSAKKDATREGDVVYVLGVSESWKRQLGEQITIHSGTTCSFDADVGRKYVIFIKRNQAGNYYTAQCLGNRPESKANPTLNYLRSIKPAK